MPAFSPPREIAIALGVSSIVSLVAVVLVGVTEVHGLGYINLQYTPNNTAAEYPFYTAHFGLENLCVGRRSEFESGNLDAERACLGYNATTRGWLAGMIPFGESVTVAASQELAVGSLSIAAATIGPVVPLLLLGCIAGNSAWVAEYLNMPAWLRVGIVVASLIGHMSAMACSATAATALGTVGEESKLIRNATRNWQAAIARTQQIPVSFVNVTDTIVPGQWLGMWQAAPVVVSAVMGSMAVVSLYALSRVARRVPGSATSIGCCSEEFISPEDCDTACHLCSTSTRRTRDDHIDVWVADWFRLLALPPIAVIHVVSLVMSAVAASGGLFTYRSQGFVTDARDTTVNSSAEMIYEMSFAGGCLSTNTSAMALQGYTSLACFDIARPGRLLLSEHLPGEAPPGGSDFSAVVMAEAAPIIQAVQSPAIIRVIASSIGVALAHGLSVCNMRDGAAARAFKIWGKLAGIAIILCSVIIIVTSVQVHDVRGSLASGIPLLKMTSEETVSGADPAFLALAAVTNPLQGRLQFHPVSAELVDSSKAGDDFIVISTMLSVFSAAGMLPVGLILIIGSFNGSTASVVPAGHEAASAARSVAAARAHGGAGAGNSRVISAESAGRARPPGTARADASRYGSLADTPDLAKRERLQNEAEEVAEQVAQVRASGLDESIADALLQSKQPRVARRARELLAASTAAVPVKSGTSSALAAAVAPPPAELGGTAAVPAGRHVADASPVVPGGTPAAPAAPQVPAGLGGAGSGSGETFAL